MYRFLRGPDRARAYSAAAPTARRRRALGPDTDCVTALCINPTTAQSRRSNFERNNPTKCKPACPPPPLALSSLGLAGWLVCRWMVSLVVTQALPSGPSREEQRRCRLERKHAARVLRQRAMLCEDGVTPDPQVCQVLTCH